MPNPTKYPGLDEGYSAQINNVLDGRPVDRTQFYEKRVAVFHRRDLGTQMGAGITTFFSTSQSFNQSICTLPGGRSTINAPIVVESIGFQFEGLNVNESTGAVAAVASWYADTTSAGANKASQFTALNLLLQACTVTVRQRELQMAQARLCDFPQGNGANIGSVTTPTVTAAAWAVTQAIGNGGNWPGARYKLPDPLVVLPDQAISIDLYCPFTTALAFGYQTAGCFTLYGSQISRGGAGIN